MGNILFMGKIFGITSGQFQAQDGTMKTWLNFSLGTASVREKIQKKDEKGNLSFQPLFNGNGEIVMGENRQPIMVPVFVAGRTFTRAKAWGATADRIIKLYKEKDAMIFDGSLEKESFWMQEKDEDGNKLVFLSKATITHDVLVSLVSQTGLADWHILAIINGAVAVNEEIGGIISSAVGSQLSPKQKLIEQTVIYIDRIKLP